jgi:hypothetical protein
MRARIRGVRRSSARWMTIMAGMLVASAAVFWPMAASTASFTAPSNKMQFNLAACDTSFKYVSGSYDPDASPPDLTCNDDSYQSANLGKNWAELDLVPHRLTAKNSDTAAATYNLWIGGDHFNGGSAIGWDDISDPVVNTSLSSGSCQATADPAQILHITGGTTDSIVRQWTVAQSAGSTCVFDWVQRLAVGAHNFNGSSLQSYMFESEDFSQGKRTLSLPVTAILPQALSKTMAASQNTDHIWSLSKTPTPSRVDFLNTCSPNASFTRPLSIELDWTKGAASPSGDITLDVSIYANNPALRSIDTTVEDKIYGDVNSVTTLLDDHIFGPTTVPANSNNFGIASHYTITVPDGTTNINDVATGSYTDHVTGVPIPQTTSATASVSNIQTGTDLNQSATISDSESITGTGLDFKVTSPTTGYTGTPAYVADTYTTGPVEWGTSATDSGLVTFSKTIRLDISRSLSGSIADTATLNGSNGAYATASSSVAIVSEPKVSLEIDKTISAKVGTDQTFKFDITGPSGYSKNGVSVTVSQGSTSGSTTLTDLDPGSYTVVEEDPGAPWGTPSATGQTSTISASDCSGIFSFANTFAPAVAKASKATVPSGHEAGWSLTLHGNDGSHDETIVTGGAGLQSFSKTLVDGVMYTISETSQSGWDQTGVSGSGNVTVGTSTCSFTVHYPADAGAVFSCSFTNTARGSLKVTKVVNWNGITPDASQTFVICIKGPSYPLGTESGACHTYGSTGGDYTWSNLLPGNYVATETSPGTSWTVTGDNGATIAVPAGGQGTGTITNTRKLGSLKVTKTVNWIGSNPDTSKTFQICITGPSYPLGTETGACQSIGYNGGNLTWSNLIPGSYTVSETNPGSQWTVVVTGSPATVPTDGGQATASVSNTLKPGQAKVVKTVSGAAPSGTQSFTFQLRQGASAAAAGTIIDGGTANAADGGVITFSTALVPGATYQLCEQMQPGWTTTLGPPLYSVYNPSGDNSVVCTDFTVTAGQTKEFDIDNKPPPGGMALTIGYWKNWSSCSGGGQKPTLDQTLLKLANAGTPVTLGKLVLDPGVLGASTACKYAVNILNKTTIDGKTKMSSDPLFNMAAQLLAADMNVGAGAGQCPASASAINQAHALLTKYGFDGLKSSKTLGVTPADATLANNLATTLDKYNNNKLC